MRSKGKERFITVRSEGGLLPIDFLERIARLDGDIDGLKAEQYHLFEHEKINEAINRAWDRLMGCWVSFKSVVKAAAPDDLLLKETRDRWLLPLFDELGYGRLIANKAIDLDGKSFPISHFWQSTPIHLVGARIDLDKRTSGVAGAARSTPHGMVQEFLNRSDAHLWAFLSNGPRLRLLRDNVSLTRQAYLEFDLEGMMEDELFSDFRLLWLLCHESRVESEDPANCYLERWSKAALETGIRVRDQLREGVEEAISFLGTGLLQHPANNVLRQKVRSGELTAQEFYRQVLRLIYRLLFLFVAEDRDLLLLRDAPHEAKQNYYSFYSTRRIRDLAGSIRGSRHSDLWECQRLIFETLQTDDGLPALALPCLGSFLWSPESTGDLVDCKVSNRSFLEAVRCVSYAEEGKARRHVDYKNLRSEELGSIYESLLELQPLIDANIMEFRLVVQPGHERKTTGSYYTPPSLVSSLLDSALDPAIARAKLSRDPEAALFDLKVCDPSCGSGHFLIAAAHRIAKAIASVRSGDEEPPPDLISLCLNEVIGRCVHGVDVNPMAVELCKIALWIESMVPGRPLSFLDSQILCGDSLLGATPNLIAAGIPDSAFEAIEGDTPKVCTELKKRNKSERAGARQLQIDSLHSALVSDLATLCQLAVDLTRVDGKDIAEIKQKNTFYKRLLDSDEYRRSMLIADAWCASFTVLKDLSSSALTEAVFRQLQHDPQTVHQNVVSAVRREKELYNFFHWHLAFPTVFAKENSEANSATGWTGGFDVVLGNPPWEKLTIRETEFFSGKDELIALTKTKAVRERELKNLQQRNPLVFEQYMRARRVSAASTALIQSSGRFPYSSAGELNTYLAFTELGSQIVQGPGRVGMVVKSSIFTSATAQPLFSYLCRSRRMVSLFDFRNWQNLFPAVGFHERFSLVTFTGFASSSETAEYAFYCDKVQDLEEPNRKFLISCSDMQAISPNTGACPALTSLNDFRLLKEAVSKFGVLVTEGNAPRNSYGIAYGSLYHMSGASDQFKTKEELFSDGLTLRWDGWFQRENGKDYAPFFEGKLINQFDHRFASFEGVPASKRFGKKPGTHTPTLEQKLNAKYSIETRYWIDGDDARARLREKLGDVEYYCGARLVTNVISNARTVMVCILPAVPANNMVVTLGLDCYADKKLYARRCAVVTGLFNSFAFDYFARLKVSENLLKGVLYEVPAPPFDFLKDLPWPGKEGAPFIDELLPRVLELTYTSDHLRAFARDLGFDGPAFKWDPLRRAHLRAEIDAAFFYAYGIDRADLPYILDSFPIIMNRELDRDGEYVTKKLIVQAFESMDTIVATR